MQLQKNDPLTLLHKLEEYSAEQLSKLTSEDREGLLKEIEGFLTQGFTPLEKFYNEIKDHFSIPSAQLLEYDKKHFTKQLEKVRQAHKQESANVIK